ncbi:MAG: hypothetical protein HY738_15475 [Bacteroidia bacterium]|nr:hypothetical protein [Bacteroidia bacterium]
METEKKDRLANMVLATYIQKATALIGKKRKIGGNQFRHSLATMSILIDYKLIDVILLKVAIIHDLFEDVPNTDPEDIRRLPDGEKVVPIAIELTRKTNPFETKEQYLQRLIDNSSLSAKKVKIADRISNLTDLNKDIFDINEIEKYINETKQYIIPLADKTIEETRNSDHPEEEEIIINMKKELLDLINRREKVIETYKKISIELHKTLEHIEQLFLTSGKIINEVTN